MDWDSFCLRLMGPLCAMGEQSRFDSLTHSGYCIMVDLRGRRYAAEPAIHRMDPFDFGHVQMTIPKGRSYYLYSANVMERIIQESRNPDALKDGPFGQPALPDLAVVDDWFQKECAKGHGKIGIAASWEELAAQTGIDRQGLLDTVAQYNEACRRGVDWICCKEPQFLIPLEQGPYYAVEGRLSTDGSFGGVRVNPDMQAYRPDGTLVEGLFVTGDFASGRHIVMGKIKRQVLNDMSWALASGFLAGGSAARAVGGNV